jgi:trimeric autotransporter adhesin
MKLLLRHGQCFHGLERSGTEPKRLDPTRDACAPETIQSCSSADRRSAIIRKMTQAKLLFPPLAAPLMAAFLSLVVNANGHAQTNKLLLSASVLQFSVQEAVAQPPAKTVLITSSGIPLIYAVGVGYVSTATEWLSVAMEANVTPSTLTVNVDTHGLASGMYMGFVRISCGSAQEAFLTVTLKVGGPDDGQVGIESPVLHSPPIEAPRIPPLPEVAGARPLSVFPKSLTFNYQIGTSAPSPQPVLALTSRRHVGLKASPSADWIKLAPDFATAPSHPLTRITTGNFNVFVDPSTLGPGSYSATLEVSDSENHTESIPLTLNVSADPYVLAQPHALAFTWSRGQAMPAPQTLEINGADGSLNYNASVDSGSWLAIEPASGSTFSPNSISVTVDPERLADGQYTGSISVAAPGAASASIPVTLSVGAASTAGLSVNPSSDINFQAALGGAPQTRSISVTSSIAGESFFVDLESRSWLSVSQHSGTTPATVTITADPSVLSYPGSLSGFVIFTGLPNGEQQVVNVGITVIAEPNSLSFSQTVGGAAPAAQFVSIASTVAGTAFTAASNATWLTVAPGSATTPETLTVSVNASGLAANTYQGAITVTAGTTTLTVPVTLTLPAATTSLTATPTSLSFSQAIGGTAPAAQTVSISSTGTATAFTAASNVTWLSVAPGNATTPGTLTVSVNANASGLAAGPNQGTIRVTAGTTTVTVPVTLTLSASGSLTASPASLSFSQAIGGTAAASQNIVVDKAGGTTTFTASSNAAWLAVAPANATTPATLTVSVNASGLAANTYQGSITLTAGTVTLSVPVTLTVSSATSLNATPASLSFSQATGGTAPAAQTVSITSTGTATAFTAASNATWLSVASGNATTPGTLTVSVNVNASGLAGGTYQGAITVTAGTATLSVPVTLTVSSATSLTAAPSSLSFSQTLGGAAPVSQTIRIDNSSGAITFTAGSNSTWLAVAPANATTPATLTVSVSASGLAASTYQGAVTVTAGTMTLSVPVTFTVSDFAPTIIVTPASLSFSQTLGGAAPALQTIRVDSASGSTAFTAGWNGGWLRALPPTGTTPAFVTVFVNASGLVAGIYQGSVMVTAGSTTLSVPVTFTVSDVAPTVTPVSLSFSQTPGGAAPASQSVRVDKASGATNFTANWNSTWLMVAPANGTTPATLTVSANVSGLAAGTYQDSIVVTAGATTTSVPVTLTVSSGIPTIAVTPASLSFSQTLGGTPPASQTVRVDSVAGATTFTANSNASWMSVTPVANTSPANLTVSVTTTGLAAGTYQGSIAINAGTTSLAVPVTLTVSNPGGSLTIQPATLTFTGSVGATVPAPQTVTVVSAGSPVAFSTTASTVDQGNWLTVTPATGITPASLKVAVAPAGLPAGQYMGAITITPSDTSLNKQVINLSLTLSGTGSGGATAPIVVSIMNAASMQPNTIAPGEIVFIWGTGLGPEAGAGPNILPAGAVSSTVGDTRVLFDGIPAPLLFVQSHQITAIVPYEVYSHYATIFQVEVAGRLSDPLNLRVEVAAPGIFTMNRSGTGQGSVVNQDGTVNSPLYPAARDSVISIYGTGEGQTSPPGQDGRIIATDVRTPISLVSVKINGVPVEVRYAGSAAGFASGAFQINAYLPPNVATGGQVPVEILVGNIPGQLGVTMAIK